MSSSLSRRVWPVLSAGMKRNNAMISALFQVSRKEFSKITSADHAHLVTLLSGDTYAVENMTRTDRLGLLMRGR